MRRSILFYFIMSLIFLSFVSCSSKRTAAYDQRKQEAKQEQRYDEGEEIINKARDRHYDMQTADTQRRMRETKRKSESWNYRGHPFYVRWYRAFISLFK